jgi:hypothetical protein
MNTHVTKSQFAKSPARQQPLMEVVRLKEENSKLRKALERVRGEILSRYIPFDLQEEIRKALES